MRHNTLFRESLRLLHKFVLNFGMRTIFGAGKLVGAEEMLIQLLSSLFTFSITCMQCNFRSHKKHGLLMIFAGHLNHTWGRISIDTLLKTETNLTVFFENHAK